MHSDLKDLRKSSFQLRSQAEADGGARPLRPPQPRASRPRSSSPNQTRTSDGSTYLWRQRRRRHTRLIRSRADDTRAAGMHSRVDASQFFGASASTAPARGSAAAGGEPLPAPGKENEHRGLSGASRTITVSRCAISLRALVVPYRAEPNWTSPPAPPAALRDRCLFVLVQRRRTAWVVWMVSSTAGRQVASRPIHAQLVGSARHRSAGTLQDSKNLDGAGRDGQRGARTGPNEITQRPFLDTPAWRYRCARHVAWRA